MRWLAAGTIAACACAWIPTSAAAQAPTEPATRAEALERLRAARERVLAPYQPGTIERALLYVEEKRVIERLNPPEGLYPRLGSVVRGSGWGLGVGYRERTWSNRLVFDTSGAWTFRGYKTLETSVALQGVGGRPVEARVGTRWFDYTQEDFFGIGGNSAVGDRTSYGLEGWDTFGQIQARRAGWFVVHGRLGVLHTDVGPGTDSRFPSLEERFTDAAAPGLDQSPTFVYAEASAGVDTRDQPGNTRGGGLYRVTFGGYRDRRDEGFDFNRIDAQAMYVIPIFDKKRGIALNAVASRIDPVGSNRVPFFFMPTVGGADSLRGFRDFRFRDASVVFLNAEYRWEGFSGLDLALFADAGQAGPSWDALAIDRFKTSWGVGFRFNTNRRVFLRVDVATGGGEGTRIWLRTGPVFNR